LGFEAQLDVAQVYLLAMSVLAVALADARNEGLKTGLSVFGLILALAWMVSLGESDLGPDGPSRSLVSLQLVGCLSCAAWVISLAIHARNLLRRKDPEVSKHQLLVDAISSLRKPD
jgi:hypothetical protein